MNLSEHTKNNLVILVSMTKLTQPKLSRFSKVNKSTTNMVKSWLIEVSAGHAVRMGIVFGIVVASCASSVCADDKSAT